MKKSSKWQKYLIIARIGKNILAAASSNGIIAVSYIK